MNQYKKIIVTGADGWLGLGLLNELSTLIHDPDSSFYRAQLVGLTQTEVNRQRLESFGARIVVGDLVSYDTVNELLTDSEDSVIFNLAGIIHPNLFSQRDFNKLNHLAISRFADVAASRGIKKFVSVSSNSPCGYSKDPHHLFDEYSAYTPYMGYGRSKMLMEKRIISAARSSSHTNFTIIRCPWFYGPYQPARQTEFFSLIRKGIFPLFGGGICKRSMAYIDNLVQGLILSADYFQTNGEIFWIADENAYQMKEIVFTVKNILRDDFGFTVSSRQIYLPSVIPDFARYVDFSAQLMGIYIQKIHVLSEMNQTIACRIDKAKRLLKYQPRTSIEDGMRQSIKWCLDNNRVI